MLTVLIFLLAINSLQGGSAVDYDPNLANFSVMGTIHTIPGEKWSCSFNWSGGVNQNVVVYSPNLPDGMWINNETHRFGWQAEPNQVGTYYVDFFIGKVPDPNVSERIWISDKCTVVVKVEDWQNPPTWLEMCKSITIELWSGISITINF